MPKKSGNHTPEDKRPRGRPAGTAVVKHKKKIDLSSAIISDFEVLRRDAFCERMRMSRMMVRRMESEGLIVHRIGRFSFISGSDFHDFLQLRSGKQNPGVRRSLAMEILRLRYEIDPKLIEAVEDSIKKQQTWGHCPG